MAISEFTKLATSTAGTVKPVSSFTESAARIASTGSSKTEILPTVKTNQPVDFSKIKMPTTMGNKTIADYPAPKKPIVFNNVEGVAPVRVTKEGAPAPDLSAMKLGSNNPFMMLARNLVSPASTPANTTTSKSDMKTTTPQTVTTGPEGGVISRAMTIMNRISGAIPFLLSGGKSAPGFSEQASEGARSSAADIEKITGAPKESIQKTVAPAVGLVAGMIGDPLNFIGGGEASAVKAIRGIKNEGEALSFLVKLGVPEDLAKFRALDVVKADSDKAAEALINAIQKDMRTTKGTLLEKPIAPAPGKVVETKDSVGNTIKRNDLNEVIEVISKEGKTIYTADKLSPKKPIAESAPRAVKGGTKDIGQLERMLQRTQESLAAARANPEAHAKAYGGDRVPLYEAKIKEFEQRITAAKAERKAAEGTEVDSLENLAAEHAGSDAALTQSEREGERVKSNLEKLFSEMKGVDLGELNKFTDDDLAKAKLLHELVDDAITDHPAAYLMKHVSRSTGKLPEITGKLKMRSVSGSGKIVKTSKFGRSGDDIVDRGFYKSVEEAQQGVDALRSLREQRANLLAEMREISHNIRLSKQKEAFVGKEKIRLSNQAARNIDGLRALAKAAERAGYQKGLSAGSKKFGDLVQQLKTRRSKITAIKKKFNLTDTQMRSVRGPKDPRFMDETEFNTYLSEAHDRAELEFKRDQEKIFIGDTIESNELKKTENLQRALEFPPVKDMSLDQLIEFGGILSKTQPYDTFLGSRMIQTAKNTDLGNIRTIGEGRDAIAKQTGMPFGEGVEGSKTDRWLRDPTLVERDPLHKTFITEWAAREADMLTRKHELNKTLNELAGAARKARKKSGVPRTWRQKLFGTVTPEDDLIVRWLQPFETTYVDKVVNGKTVSKKVVIVQPELRTAVQAIMTPEELKYAKFLENFFSHYYNVAAQEASTRWTLLGVKHSNYRSARIESVYLPHAKRSFLEKWRDDGFMKALKIMWEKNAAESAIDFNAFGDRGEVLGYEKWLKNNMERQGEGIEKATGKVLYSQNTAKLALSYFHGFERKLLVDSMTPKIKLLEFLMGKHFETPKSITNPDGTSKVHSELSRHINEWINNKKGQRIEMAYAQGDSVETVVDGARTLIAMQQLGANVIAQVISGAGGEVTTFAGAGIKGWGLGHARSITTQGRKIGLKYSGVIGEAPWNELASSANDAGDTLRSGLFYIFGDLAFRARRQMMLGLMTKEEFAAGELTSKRAGEIKLQIGKWHTMPEFRSIAGSTSAVKAAGMYTEWATPAMQNTYFVTLPRLRNMLRSTGPDKWETVAKSEEFQSLFRSVIGGAGLAATAYLVLNPDQNDHSTLGYIKRKAAQEIGSTIQALTLWGIPIPFSVMVGYATNLENAIQLLVTMGRYQTAGPGHAAGDLSAPAAFGRVLIPRGPQRIYDLVAGAPETPLKTEDQIRKEILQGVKSGELTMSAAKKKLSSDMKSLNQQRKDRRFQLPQDQYRADLKKRVLAKEISVADAKKEVGEYLVSKKKSDPESFESDSSASFVDKVKVYAEAIGTDPVTAFNRIFTGQVIRRTDNGAIIVRRMSLDESQKVKRDRGATKDLILDHTVPLQLGGSNDVSNLKLVPKAEWERFTPIENFLGLHLRNRDIDEKDALRLMTEFKNGKLDEKGVYAEVERLTR